MEKNPTKANDPAFQSLTRQRDGYTDEITVRGVTKREYFAAMAMQAFLSNSSARITEPDDAKKIAIMATHAADCLIEKLNTTA